MNWCLFGTGADSTSMQAGGEEHGNVGVSESTSKGIRVRDGSANIRTSGYNGLVPLRFGFPNQASLQPSIQPRPSDSAYSCWWQEAQVIYEL